MRIKSDAFLNGGAINHRCTFRGGNLSPSIQWDNFSEDITDIVIILEGEKAPPNQTIVHWLIYNIPVNEGRLPEGIPCKARYEDLPEIAQGRNSFGSIGYHGPDGQETKKYLLTVCGLNKELKLPPNLERLSLLRSIENYIVEKKQLELLYQSEQ